MGCCNLLSPLQTRNSLNNYASPRSFFRSVCDLQFPVPLLWIPRWGRQHHVRVARAASARLLRQRHLLPRRRNIHHRLPSLLQASHTSVLPHQACLRVHYYLLAGRSNANLRPWRGVWKPSSSLKSCRNLVTGESAVIAWLPSYKVQREYNLYFYTSIIKN